MIVSFSILNTPRGRGANFQLGTKGERQIWEIDIGTLVKKKERKKEEEIVALSQPSERRITVKSKASRNGD